MPLEHARDAALHAGAGPRSPTGNFALERDDLSSIHHPALSYYWSMIFSENRCTLFGIML
jgi:hypothetical protein